MRVLRRLWAVASIPMAVSAPIGAARAQTTESPGHGEGSERSLGVRLDFGVEFNAVGTFFGDVNGDGEPPLVQPPYFLPSDFVTNARFTWSATAQPRGKGAPRLGVTWFGAVGASPLFIVPLPVVYSGAGLRLLRPKAENALPMLDLGFQMEYLRAPAVGPTVEFCAEPSLALVPPAQGTPAPRARRGTSAARRALLLRLFGVCLGTNLRWVIRDYEVEPGSPTRGGFFLVRVGLGVGGMWMDLPHPRGRQSRPRHGQ
jgi:hypothetical protein